MTINAFTPLVLTDTVNKIGNAQMPFMLQRVFRRRNTHKTDSIVFGVNDGNIKLSGYTRKNAPGTRVEKHGGALKALVVPEIRLVKALDRNFFETLNPGLPGYTGPVNADPNAQTNVKIAQELADQRAKIERQMEVTAADAVQNGTATLTYPDGGTVTISYEYETTPASKATIQTALTGTNKWDSADSDPLKNLRTWARQIAQYSNYGGPLDVILGYNAADALMKHTQFEKILNKQTLNLATMSLAEQGLFRGQFGQFTFWEYVQSYQNSAGTLVDAWDPKTVAVLPANGPADIFSMEFGATFDFPTPASDTPQFIQAEFFSKIAKHEDPAVLDLILQANPLPLIKNSSALRVCTVL